MPYVYQPPRIRLDEKAVNNPHWANDYKGVWHDILWMSNTRYREIDKGTREIQVIIRGAGKQSIFTMVTEVVHTVIDDAQPVIYISLKVKTNFRRRTIESEKRIGKGRFSSLWRVMATTLEDLYERADTNEETDCLEWQLSTNKDGYGYVSYKGKITTPTA